MSSSLEPQFGPARKVNAVPRRLASTAKAETLLGFTSQVTLEEGLLDLVEWWRQEKCLNAGEAA